MGNKKLLAVILLSLCLCFMVSGMGYGEINKLAKGREYSHIDFLLLNARVSYIMNNPDSFLWVFFSYDPEGAIGEFIELPDGVDTKDKILVYIRDQRGTLPYEDIFSNWDDLGEEALFNVFKVVLENIYSYIDLVAEDMNNDVVAIFNDKESISLGYFYHGEYHLWKE